MSWLKKMLKDQGGWAAIPAIMSIVSTVLANTVNKPKAPSSPSPTPASAAAAPGGAAGGAAGAIAPGTSPTDYRGQQTAYYQQMLAGLGQGQEGNQLPQGIQENIDKQASLLGG